MSVLDTTHQSFGPVAAAPGDAISWREDVDAASWDRALAALGGHPLQSALWGDARCEVDGIRDRRLMAVACDRPFWMIRIEERRLPLVGWVGWAPRGPAGPAALDRKMIDEVTRRLRRRGMRLLVTDPWREVAAGEAAPDERRPRTIWIDLTQGRERLLAGLDKQWRYGARKARQLGVPVEEFCDAGALQQFHGLCASLSREKRFRLPASIALMRLLVERCEHGAVEAALIAAQWEGKLIAGSFLIRCGTSAHYFWGATDRAYAKLRVGEAVQWASIEWTLKRGCTIYDLEGIDAAANPGTYAFKKKMGGREVALAGKRYVAASAIGNALAWMHARRRA